MRNLSYSTLPYQPHTRNEEAQGHWERVQVCLKAQLGPLKYDLMKNLQLLELVDNQVTLSASNPQALHFGNGSYKALLLELWQREVPGITAVTVEPRSCARAQPRKDPETELRRNVDDFPADQSVRVRPTRWGKTEDMDNDNAPKPKVHRPNSFKVAPISRTPPKALPDNCLMKAIIMVCAEESGAMNALDMLRTSTYSLMPMGQKEMLLLGSRMLKGMHDETIAAYLGGFSMHILRTVVRERSDEARLKAHVAKRHEMLEKLAYQRSEALEQHDSFGTPVPVDPLVDLRKRVALLCKVQLSKVLSGRKEGTLMRPRMFMLHLAETKLGLPLLETARRLSLFKPETLLEKLAKMRANEVFLSDAEIIWRQSQALKLDA